MSAFAHGKQIFFGLQLDFIRFLWHPPGRISAAFDLNAAVILLCPVGISLNAHRSIDILVFGDPVVAGIDIDDWESTAVLRFGIIHPAFHDRSRD